ncbi:MAG: metalloregulator ArsR/SmtB family transcription factor [Nitrospirota bacterium]
MQDVLNTLKALSDDTRLRILKILERGELCVCDIVASLDTIQPKISFHLKILKEAGLIRDRKQGKWIHYSINDSDMFKRFLILSVLERISDSDVREDKKRLEAFLKGKNSKDKIVSIKGKTVCCGKG